METQKHSITQQLSAHLDCVVNSVGDLNYANLKYILPRFFKNVSFGQGKMTSWIRSTPKSQMPIKQTPMLFIIVMDRISRPSQAAEGVKFAAFQILSLLFADDVVLLAS